MRMAYAHKRRRHADMVPPTKFLLGGCITDPLNLNSLQDEEVNRALNQVTPQSSPLPTPKHRKEAIEVLIPPNINDPLNLNSENDNRMKDPRFWFVNKRKRKSKSRKKSTTDTVKLDDTVEDAPKAESEETPKIEDDSLKDKDKKLWKESAKDKIVSPVIPQPGANKRPNNNRKDDDFKPPAKRRRKAVFSDPSMFPSKSQKSKFRYGNYNQYYGKRNSNAGADERLNFFKNEWFLGKCVLDIGCNIGHITLILARDYQPKRIVGMDIDADLIKIAKKNVKHYLPQGEQQTSKYPASMEILYGSLEVPSIPEKKEDLLKFPFNIEFVKGNYVPDEDQLKNTVPEFDVILALSITKWLHLNWGDDGLKRAFKKMYLQLKVGGRLILEPQSWDSYKKKKKLLDTIHENYKNIKFLPQKFTEFLLTEVGFSSCEVIGVPVHPSKGFCRPLQMFVKGDYTSQCNSALTPVKPEPLILENDKTPGCVKSACDSTCALNSEALGHCDTSPSDLVTSSNLVCTPPSRTLTSSDAECDVKLIIS